MKNILLSICRGLDDPTTTFRRAPAVANAVTIENIINHRMSKFEPVEQ